jgi:hypothetical protein
MKQVVLFGMALLCMMSAFSQEDAPFMVKKFNNVKRVRAVTSGGDISVNGSDGTEAKVEVYIRSSNWNNKLSESEIRQRLEKDYVLTMDMQGDQLVLEAKSKNNNGNSWKNGLAISFAVSVPRNTSSDIRTSGGNIVMRDLAGNQDFTTSGGNLVVKDIKGQIKGRTSGGNISAERLSDHIDLFTSGGNVSAEECKGTISLNTSGGNMNLDDLNGIITASTSGGNISGEVLIGEVAVSTSGGNVIMEKIRGSLKASTSGGHLTASVDELGKYVKLVNSGGTIDLVLPSGKGLDLDIRGSKVNTSSMQNYSGSITEGRLNGKLNGGGVPVNIDNSGRVNLSFHN